jgi:hypothetical protein
VRQEWLVAAIAGVLLWVPSISPAGDGGFDRVVRQFEKQFETRRTRIPLMGLVNGFVKVARPGGASGLKMAVFEEAGLTPADGPQVDRLVQGNLGAEWKPLVRVRSRDLEWSAVYVREAGSNFELLVASIDGSDTAFVQVRMKASRLARMLQEPERISVCAGKRTEGHGCVESAQDE